MKVVNNLRWALMTFAMIVIININAQTTDIHIVKRGETFASIAKNYGTTEAELRKANPNVKSCLAGLKLKIASPVPSKKSAPKESKISARQVKQQVQKTLYADKQTVHVFEGMLLYRNYEHHNAVVRKFSAGQAYNGERTVKVTLRENSAHIVDEDMHIHTIVIPEEDKVYMYSDVSKKGFVANGNEFLKKFFSGNNPDITPAPDTEKSSSLQTTGIQKKYKGDQCQVYAGQITVNDNLLTDVEMWYSDRLLANKSYRQLFNGLPVPGIVRKGIISQTGKLPLLGSLRSTVACELVALTECKVSDAEFAPPQDITIEPYTKDTQLHSFYKNSSKALKKAKLYPEQVKTKEIDYKIGQEWNFANEWLTKKYGSVDNNLTWAKIDSSLFRTISSISNLGGSKTENTTNSLLDIADLLDGNGTDFFDGDEYQPTTRSTSGGGSNSQVKSYESEMGRLHQRYVKLTNQYNKIGAFAKVQKNKVNAGFSTQTMIKDPRGKRERVNIQVPRAGQGMGRKVESAIKSSRQSRAIENKAVRDKEPVALEIAQVVNKMAMLEQKIYATRVQTNLFADTDQRIASAQASVNNFLAWYRHLDMINKTNSKSVALDIADTMGLIAELSRDMNNDIWRLQGMSEDEILAKNQKSRERFREEREREKDYRDGVLKRYAKSNVYTRGNRNTYMKYETELKAMENGSQPYNRDRALEMQKWMKDFANQYENSTGEQLPSRNASIENWTPFDE